MRHCKLGKDYKELGQHTGSACTVNHEVHFELTGVHSARKTGVGHVTHSTLPICPGTPSVFTRDETPKSALQTPN